MPNQGNHNDVGDETANKDDLHSNLLHIRRRTTADVYLGMYVYSLLECFRAEKEREWGEGGLANRKKKGGGV